MKGGSIKLYIGPMFSGKCLGAGTQVRIFGGGHRAVEDLHTHDQLVGDDAAPRRVLAIISGTGELYRVDGPKRSYVVNDAHIMTMIRHEDSAIMDVPLMELITLPASGAKYSGVRLGRGGRVLAYPVTISPVGRGRYYGFALDENGRFLLKDGTITHNTSAMCSGIDKYVHAHKSCVIVKYAGDTRFDNALLHGGVMAHSGQEYFKVPIRSAARLSEIYEELLQYDVVGIDEVQFFSDCVEVLQRLANCGKIVIAAGLDGDALARPFGAICDLIPLAESVNKLHAVCMMCHSRAAFTAKKTENPDIIDIGGSEKYMSVCRKCMWGV